MTNPADSVAATADLLEDFARSRRVADRRRRAVGVTGAGQLWQVVSGWVDGIAAGCGKTGRGCTT
jgi:hypothetical protein